MADSLWTFDQLARLTRFEDAEVRYWAADRLVHLYPRRAPEVLGGLLFDDHDSTPGLVASHLGTHGRATHFPLLSRGFRRGSGSIAGHCLEALARLGAPDAPALAREAVHRRDLAEDSLARIIDGLTQLHAGGEAGADAGAAPPTIPGSLSTREDAADAAREILMRRPELFAETAALNACFRIFGPGQIGDLLGRWITALHFGGRQGAEAGVRVFHEHLQLEDVSWCLRTGRDGRVDLNRSLRAIENAYDTEIRSEFGAEDLEALAEAFGRGEFQAIVQGISAIIDRRLASQTGPAGDLLPSKLASLIDGFRRPSTIEEAEQLGQAAHTWLIGMLLSAMFKVSRYRNLVLECEESGEEYDKLLSLAEVESCTLVRKLPAKLTAAAGDAKRDHLEHWCLATIEARGPFFPKAIALETLGELKHASHLTILLDYIADDNGYLYGAAERTLLNMGDDAVEAIRGELERQKLHPDAMHSVLHVLADVMTPAALALALDYFDEFMEAAGPEDCAELMALFGARELIPYLRRHLKRSAGFPFRLATQARVGHALLLLGAIHNVAIPEEEQILNTIDEYWKEGTEGPTGTSGSSGGGPWVM
jgi:hypothetical protein